MNTSGSLHVAQGMQAQWCWAACLSTAYAWLHGKPDTTARPPCKVADIARSLHVNHFGDLKNCCDPVEVDQCDLPQTDKQIAAVAAHNDMGLGVTADWLGDNEVPASLRVGLDKGGVALIAKRKPNQNGHLIAVTGYWDGGGIWWDWFVMHDPQEETAFWCTEEYLAWDGVYGPWDATTWLWSNK